MSKRPHIAFVIPSMRAGGTERQLLLLIQGLRRECDITLVCTREEGELFAEAVGAWISDHIRQVPYVRHAVDSLDSSGRILRGSGRYLPAQRKLSFEQLEEAEERADFRAHVLHAKSGWDFRIRRVLRDIFRANPPDLLHSFLFGFDYWAVRAARDADVPLVLTARRELAHWQARRHLWLVRRANALADAAIANSEAVADYAAAREGQPREFYQVVYNGLDDAAFAPHARGEARARFGLPPDKKVVGMVANFSPVKDHALFAAAAAEILRQVPECHFALFGQGRARQEVQTAMAQAVGGDGVSLLHSLEEMPLAYAAMDVCVLTSRMEGAPNALLEAMAASRPVVAPAVGGIPELVADGETGHLIHSRNPSDFAARVVELLRDDEAAHRMGMAGQSRMRARFTAERMVNEHRMRYLECLASKAR